MACVPVRCSHDFSDVSLGGLACRNCLLPGPFSGPDPVVCDGLSLNAMAAWICALWADIVVVPGSCYFLYGLVVCLNLQVALSFGLDLLVCFAFTLHGQRHEM